jgi:predicted ribosomally synthesized peptide with SipW-like signal peptide
MVRIISLIILGIAFLGIVLSSTTNAFFTDSATSTTNVFGAATAFPTATPSATITSTPGNIVINEVSSDGITSAEWVEIYNGSTNPIDVSGWKISDKNAFDTAQDDTFPTVSPIPVGGYGVIITNNTNVSGIPVSAIIITINGNIGSGLNDTGDAVIIKNATNTIIDAMSYGSETSIFTFPTTANSGQSLRRNPNGVDTNTAADWILDTSPTIGSINN